MRLRLRRTPRHRRNRYFESTDTRCSAISNPLGSHSRQHYGDGLIPSREANHRLTVPAVVVSLSIVELWQMLGWPSITWVLRGGAMPRRVFLFSGHMVDRSDRPHPRFPPGKEAVAARATAGALADFGAGSSDLGLCSAAAGGDILFAETCLARGLRLEVRIPFAVTTFLIKSVTYAGNGWHDRFCAVVHHPNTRLIILPEEFGPTPVGVNPYARTNRWQLEVALGYGPEQLVFLCLWDGQAGDGPGGTSDMVDAVRARGGRVHILDTTTLFFTGATPWRQ